MKILLNTELNMRYGIQLEYMAHTGLEIMKLNDGNTAVIRMIIFILFLNIIKLTN